MITIRWIPYNENVQYKSFTHRHVRANFAHVRAISRTQKTQTAPAAGDLMSGNRGSGRPRTYPTGKLPTGSALKRNGQADPRMTYQCGLRPCQLPCHDASRQTGKNCCPLRRQLHDAAPKSTLQDHQSTQAEIRSRIHPQVRPDQPELYVDKGTKEVGDFQALSKKHLQVLADCQLQLKSLVIEAGDLDLVEKKKLAIISFVESIHNISEGFLTYNDRKYIKAHQCSIDII